MTKSPLAHRRPGAKTVAVALVAALGGALWLGATTSTPASAVQTSAALASELNAAPQASDDDRKALRAAIMAARQLKGPERREALKKVKADAAAGKYGDKVEKRADRREAARKAHFALLPDALQADLTAMRAMERGDARKKARDDIRKKALAGDYGAKVKEAAELMEPFRKK